MFVNLFASAISYCPCFKSESVLTCDLITLILTFWPLNGVTGHVCHGLPSSQFSTCYALPFSTYSRHWTDRQMDKETAAINA